MPVPVHHAVPAAGFIIHDGTTGLVFSGDTGPTDEIWKVAREFKGIHAIIVETAFPNRLEDLASVSGHFTPALLQREMDKMPDAPRCGSTTSSRRTSRRRRRSWSAWASAFTSWSRTRPTPSDVG